MAKHSLEHIAKLSKDATHFCPASEAAGADHPLHTLTTRMNLEQLYEHVSHVRGYVFPSTLDTVLMERQGEIEEAEERRQAKNLK